MRNPLYGLIAFLIVEGLVASGFISKENAMEAQSQAENVIFYIALVATGLVGFSKYIEAHKHQVTADAEVKKASFIQEPSVKIQSQVEQVFTRIDSGTPPSSVEQNLGTVTPKVE